jgi:hypothetical protein
MRRSLPTGSEPEHWPTSENPLKPKFGDSVLGEVGQLGEKRRTAPVYTCESGAARRIVAEVPYARSSRNNPSTHSGE